MAKHLRRTTLLFLLFPIVNQALATNLSTEIKHPKYQYRKSFAPTTGSFLLSAQSSLASFASSAPRPYYGISAEYYFYKNWSVMGGIQLSPGDFKFTPAPFTAELFKFMSTEKHGDYHHYHGSAKGFCYLLVSLAMNDGVGYNIPLGKYIHLMPYFGTWQFEMQYAGVGDKWNEVDRCSMGMCMKIQPARHLLINLGGEYNRSVLFSDSAEGYRMNFSIGYRFS